MSEARRTGTDRPFDARSGLLMIGGFVGFGLTLSTMYATTGLGFPCPFRALTGWECPLCGGTRLGADLLRLQPGQAFAANPLVFVGLALLPVFAVLWVIECLGGPAVRPPARVAGRLRRIHPTQWLILFSVLAVVYTVVRNLA